MATWGKRNPKWRWWKFWEPKTIPMTKEDQRKFVDDFHEAMRSAFREMSEALNRANPILQNIEWADNTYSVFPSSPTGESVEIKVEITGEVVMPNGERHEIGKRGEPYTCALCGESFLKGRDDSEAMEEFNQIFPGEEPAGVVCDDCWKAGGGE